jgi:hypothetical protein
MLSSICCNHRCSFARVSAIAVVHRLELAAVDGHKRLGKQVQLATQHHELPTHPPDRVTVVLAKIGNGLEVRRQPSRQPHQLDVTLRLALQPPTGLDPVHVPLDVQLLQRRRVIPRTAGGRRFGGKAQTPQI